MVKKRKSFTYTAPDGSIWDSAFEFKVFTAYQQAGYPIYRCGDKGQDFQLQYTQKMKSCFCKECGGEEIYSRHFYTPDFYLLIGNELVFIEAKGYMRAQRRSLMRAFCASRNDVKLLFIAQRDYKVTKKLTLTEWACKFLKCESFVFSPPKPFDPEEFKSKYLSNIRKPKNV